MSTGQSDGGIFSTDAPFPQMTVAYVKLTKNKQYNHQLLPYTKPLHFK